MKDVTQEIRPIVVARMHEHAILQDWNLKESEESLFEQFLSEDLGFEHGDSVALIIKDGGGEGGGEHVEAVFRVDAKHYKATWRYYSHYGFDFDYLEVYEVVPKEKMVIVYDAI